MSDWLLFIIASLAVYRVARMVAEEDGPAFAFRRLRERYTNDKSSIAVGIRCPYCVGVWVAGTAMLLLVIVAGWDVWLFPLWWFGLAGAAAKIHEFWKRG
jgi:hypothetical protein